MSTRLQQFDGLERHFLAMLERRGHIRKGGQPTMLLSRLVDVETKTPITKQHVWIVASRPSREVKARYGEYFEFSAKVAPYRAGLRHGFGLINARDFRRLNADEASEVRRIRREVKSPISDEAAIGDDPESRGDPYVGSAK